MTAATLLLVLFAPLPFWALGLPWVLRGESRRIPLAPLIGCALAGWYGEVAMILGLPCRAFVGGLVIASAILSLLNWERVRGVLSGAVVEWAPIYLVSVLAASVSPFPVVGSWSGDWLLLYQMGQAILHGELGPDMLARPPVFGAAAIPLWIVAKGLIPYQLMAAVASAAAVTATLAFIDHFWRRTPRYVLLPLLLSPFFLHHTAAAWGKLLAGGLVLAALVEGLRAQRLASAALFALSMAVHEGSVVWAPCILLAHASGGAGWRGALKAAGPMGLCSLAVVAPLQVWILSHYGLAAKIASNPVISDRAATPTPFWLNTLLGIVATFVGWGPVVNLTRWVRGPHPLSMAVASKETFWLIASWVTTMAGTLFGLLFPFAIVARRRLDSPARRLMLGRAALAGIGFAIVVTALLAAFYSPEGTMQNAQSPLALALYGLGVGALAAEGAAGLARVRTMAWIMAAVGTLPWAGLNLLFSVGLWRSAGFRARMQMASEGDYFRVLDNHLAPLGMVAFPQVPLLCVSLLVVWALWRRRTGRPMFVEENA